MLFTLLRLAYAEIISPAHTVSDIHPCMHELCFMGVMKKEQTVHMIDSLATITEFSDI